MCVAVTVKKQTQCYVSKNRMLTQVRNQDTKCEFSIEHYSIWIRSAPASHPEAKSSGTACFAWSQSEQSGSIDVVFTLWRRVRYQHNFTQIARAWTTTAFSCSHWVFTSRSSATKLGLDTFISHSYYVHHALLELSDRGPIRGRLRAACAPIGRLKIKERKPSFSWIGIWHRLGTGKRLGGVCHREFIGEKSRKV